MSRTIKEMLKEIVRAVAVLSLFVFALTQAFPTSAAPQSSPVATINYVSAIVSVAPFCGGGDDHGDLSHSACHACRFDAAALPSPPCTPHRAFAAPAAVSFEATPLLPLFGIHRGFALSRAPPTV